MKASLGIRFCQSLLWGLRQVIYTLRRASVSLPVKRACESSTVPSSLILGCPEEKVSWEMPGHPADMGSGRGWGQEILGNHARQGRWPFLVHASISAICNFLKSSWFGDLYFFWSFFPYLVMAWSNDFWKDRGKNPFSCL